MTTTTKTAAKKPPVKRTLPNKPVAKKPAAKKPAPQKAPAKSQDTAQAAAPAKDQAAANPATATSQPVGEATVFEKVAALVLTDADGNLPEAKELAAIKEAHWDAQNCDALPAPVAFVLFDASVAQGPVVARRLLQKALGTGVKADGDLGTKTMEAIAKADLPELVQEYCAWRLRRYAFEAGAATQMVGNARRVLKCLLGALLLDMS